MVSSCLLIYRTGTDSPAIKLFYIPAPIGVTYEEISERRAACLEPPFKLYGSRVVLYNQTSEATVNRLLDAVQELGAEKAAAGFLRGADKELNDVHIRTARRTY